MSSSIYKSKYNCDCGVKYGSCESECSIILISNNSLDLYTIYHTDGHGKTPVTSKGGLESFGDAYLQALHKIFTYQELDELTEEERKVIFKNAQ